jgi:hypothetical protein
MLCGSAGTDLCHGFARGAVIGQPLCDHPSMCWWGCRDCHDLYDGRRQPTGRELLAADCMREHIASQAMDAFGLREAAEREQFGRPVDAVRWLERRLRDTGQIHGRSWAE